MRTEQEVRDEYNSEPWGKLLRAMGRDPYDTESSAREVARYAAEKIDKMERMLYMFVDPCQCSFTDTEQKIYSEVKAKYE